MTPPRPTSWLPITGALVLVAGALGWLLLSFAGDRSGRRSLPDAAGSRWEVLLDNGRGLTQADVLRVPAEEWLPVVRDEDFYRKGGQTIWVRATLRNPGDQPLRAVLVDKDYFLDRVDAWIGEDGGWRRASSGEAVPAKEKALAGRDVAFPVTVPAHGETVVYLKIHDRLSLFLWWSWWPSQAEFQLAQTRGLLAEGVYLGVLLALFGYNTVLWLRLRVADIGCYVLYLGTVASFFLLARAHVVALGWPLASPQLETLLVLAMAAMSFFLTRFVRVFLEINRDAMRARRLLGGLEGLAVFLGVAALTTPWFDRAIWMMIVVPLSGLTHVSLLGLAIWSWRRGVRQARFFVISFGCLFAGSLPAVASWMWDVALKELAMQGLMVGSALEMMLLALMTADRFARAQREKVAVQERLVVETEQRRAIEEAYADDLAAEVRERTSELEEANADKDRMLAVIGHDLRSPLTGLMQSADQATGEFARDTARTGRALLLMIEDLVLWARLRAGTSVVADHSARALVAPAVALHRALAERGGTELRVEVPEDLRVMTDLVLAQTLVRNLLANALKFARTRVVLRAVAAAGGGVRVTVGNDGPALSAEVAARIAAEEDGPMTATGGLGLRLCREICRALGLKLEARVAPAGGTEFGFTLKAAPTTAAASRT